MTKRISLVVTFDTETEKATVDLDASTILFPEGTCWDDEQERWVEELELVNDLTRRVNAQLASAEQSATPNLGVQVPVQTKFIELALNIIDPDGAWDPEETLEFGDAARIYLSEYPITNWEIEGAFALVAQFVHDWALDEARGTDGTSLGVDRVGHLVASQPASAATVSMLERPSGSSESVISEMETGDWLRRTSLETEDPLSGTTLRMIFGDYAGVPTLALFVGEDEDPILIDRSALQIAMEQGWATDLAADASAISFRPNADYELEVIDLDVGPEFE